MTCGIFAALVSVFLLVLALSMRTGISALQKNTKEGKSRRVAHARCESIVTVLADGHPSQGHRF
jgi:hypothetical protein